MNLLHHIMEVLSTFDGSGDYIEVGSAGESDFNFGSGDFTIETWINVRDFSGNPGFGIWDNSSSESKNNIAI